MNQIARPLQRTLLLCLALALTAAACAAPWAASKPQTGGTFAVALDAPILTLDPANVTELSSARVAAQIYETLVEFNSETGAFTPLLAQTWAVSDDGRVWTFTLRSGVTFQDGTPLTADAAVENFNRWLDTANPYHQGDFDYWQILFGGFRGSGSVVRSVQRVDDLRFSVTLEQPWSPLLAALSMYPFSIVSPSAMHKDVDALRRNPVGTGPFKTAGWNGGGSLTLMANPNYWGGRPNVDAVRFEVIAEATARLNALREGKIHLVVGADAAMVAAGRKMTGVKDVVRPGQSVAFLSINQKADPFTDARVRQAIAYAINRRAIIDKAYGGLAQTADGFVPPSIAGKEGEPADIYKKDSAIKLMSDAGYGGGVITQVWYPSHARPNMPNPKAMAESIAADLRDIGILVSLNTADAATYQRRSIEGGYPLYLQTWTGDSPDMDSYLSGLFAGDTVARSIGYDSPQLKTTLASARTEHSGSRSSLYDRAQTTIRNDMARIPLVYPQGALLVSDKVSGFSASALNVESFRNIRVTR